MNPHRKPRHRWEALPARPDLADLETRQWPLPGALSPLRHPVPGATLATPTNRKEPKS